MSKEEKQQYLKYILWINLVLGLQNIYFYVNNDSYFNLFIGALNIGVWVFWRHIAFGNWLKTIEENKKNWKGR